MEKRPLSLTIIAWILIIFSLLGLAGVFMMSSNPLVAAKLAATHMPIAVLQAWSVIGTIVNLICAYGILKGLPWSRVLYVVWGVIGLIAGFYISPEKSSLLISLVLLVVFSIFLFGEKANVWFQARGFMLNRESMPG